MIVQIRGRREKRERRRRRKVEEKHRRLKKRRKKKAMVRRKDQLYNLKKRKKRPISFQKLTHDRQSHYEMSTKKLNSLALFNRTGDLEKDLPQNFHRFKMKDDKTG